MAGRADQRHAVVRPFLSLLGEVIAFDAAPEGRLVLEALRRVPELTGRQKVRDDEMVNEGVTGSWRQGTTSPWPTPSTSSSLGGSRSQLPLATCD